MYICICIYVYVYMCICIFVCLLVQKDPVDVALRFATMRKKGSIGTFCTQSRCTIKKKAQLTLIRVLRP